MLAIFKKHIPSILMLAALLVGVSYVVNKYRPPGAMTVLESQVMDMHMAAPPGTVPVVTEKVEMKSFRPAVVTTGTVEAYGDEDIVARVTGRVLRVQVYPGQHVAAGQLVAELDSTELSSRLREAELGAAEKRVQARVAQAALEKTRMESLALAKELESARASDKEMDVETETAHQEWKVQKAETERTERLFREGGASQEEQQAAQFKLYRAKAEWHHREMRQKKAHIMIQQVQAKQAAQRAESRKSGFEVAAAQAGGEKAGAEMETAAITRDYTQIRSLEEGEVTQRLVAPGTLVMPGTVILKLKKQTRLRLQGRVPAQYLGQVRAGSRVEARLQDAMSKPFEARITSVFRDVDLATRTFTVEATVDSHAASRPLVAGEFVELTVPLAAPADMITVPLPALHKDLDGHAFVWRVRREAPQEGATYTCVMHPEINLPQAGKCPKCGMELVPREKTGDRRADKAVVEVSGQDGERAGILKGLSVGEEIVVSGGENLRDGTPVSVAPAPTPTATGSPPPPPKGTSGYTCEMHPQVHSDKPGKCPICGMDLIKR